MLTDLKPIKIPITLNGNKTYLRYNLNSRVYLEHFYPDYEKFISCDTDQMKTSDLLHLLRAGLIDSCFEFNEKFLDNGEFENIQPSISALGKILNEESRFDILSAITDAFIASLPVPAIGSENFQMGGVMH